MLAGALLLLATSILGAAIDDLPDAFSFVAYGFGYVLLAVGFAQRMRNRGTR